MEFLDKWKAEVRLVLKALTGRLSQEFYRLCGDEAGHDRA